MQAYLNDAKLKKQTVAAMKADIKAEALVQGHYWNGSNGCFVGCVIRGNSHADFELKLGIPRLLARLADRIFEGLKYSEAKQFSVDFLQAIKPGADLSLVWPKFAVFMLADKDYGVLKFAKTDEQKALIQEVAGLYQRVINGEKISTEAWKEVASRAWEIRRIAAYAYAETRRAAYAETRRAAYAETRRAAYAYAATDAAAYAAAAAAYAETRRAAYAYAADAADAAAATAAAYAAYAAETRRAAYAALAERLIAFLKEAA